MQWMRGAVHAIEEAWDKGRFMLRKRLGKFRPLIIQTYLTFGNTEKFFIKGRVLEQRLIPIPTPKDSRWKTFKNRYKNFLSKEIPHAIVCLEHGGQKIETTADEEGYFSYELKPTKIDASKAWQKVKIRLIDAPVPNFVPVEETTEVLVPAAAADFGIISDIDDTVLHTGATSIWKMLRYTLFHNVHFRLPFEGVAAFYRALEKGPSGKKTNPLFYVSSSPWNLYPFLIDFLIINDIPLGPLMLKDYGISPISFFSKGHTGHKLEQIEHILSYYPDTPFILIGDSGQDDPAIYRQVIKDFPGRILAAYIRDVKLAEKAEVVKKISEELSSGEVPMILVENTYVAAKDAVARGYIRATELKNIKKEKESDQR